jgi:hypothetical protein
VVWLDVMWLAGSLLAFWCRLSPCAGLVRSDSPSPSFGFIHLAVPALWFVFQQDRAKWGTGLQFPAVSGDAVERWSPVLRMLGAGCITWQLIIMVHARCPGFAG